MWRPYLPSMPSSPCTWMFLFLLLSQFSALRLGFCFDLCLWVFVADLQVLFKLDTGIELEMRWDFSLLANINTVLQISQVMHINLLFLTFISTKQMDYSNNLPSNSVFKYTVYEPHSHKHLIRLESYFIQQIKPVGFIMDSRDVASSYGHLRNCSILGNSETFLVVHDKKRAQKEVEDLQLTVSDAALQLDVMVE